MSDPEIEVFSEDFWFLLSVAEHKSCQSSTLDALHLERLGYLKKEFVSEVTSQEPLLGALFPSNESGKYEVHLTKKGRAWAAKYRKMKPAKLLSQVKDLFSWGAGLLKLSGGHRWDGPYRGAETSFKQITLETVGWRSASDLKTNTMSGMKFLGVLKPINKKFEYQPNPNAKITPKGRHFLKYIADRIPGRLLTFALQHKNLEGVANIKNLRLLNSALRKIKPDDWFPLFSAVDPVTRHTWGGKETVYTDWHRGTTLNLASAAEGLPNFRKAIAAIAIDDWDSLLADIDPAILNIIASKPELQIGLDPLEILEKTQLLYKAESSTIETLIKYQPGFVATLNSIPLSEWAVILIKAKPPVRKLLGKVIKASLAKADAHAKIE